MRDRHYKLTPEPLSEEARKILTGGRDEMIRDATMSHKTKVKGDKGQYEMNERIKAALERAAEIEERRQGHVVESTLEEKESKEERVSEKGYIGSNGQKVHLVTETELAIRRFGSHAYAACGIGGGFHPTPRPVDCKVCLRHIAKAEGLKAK